MSRLVTAQPETQTPPLSQGGMWPGGEPQGVRDAYDRQAALAVPAPRSAR